MQDDDYIEYLADIEFQRQLDLQAIANTFTEEDFSYDPTLRDFTRRNRGGPVRRYNVTYPDRYDKITAALKEREKYLEEQRRLVELSRNDRMLKEIEEFGLQQNALFRAKRNENIAILRLRLKKELNK